MKILLCLNQDIYSNIALNYLTKIFAKNEIKICFSQKVGKRANFADLDDLIFLEQELPNSIIFPLVENQQKQIQQKFLTFNQIIKTHKINIAEFQDINKDGIDYLKNWQADLVISVRYGKIFKGDIINIPKYGIINLHSGILPNYRGVMSTFWTMLNDDDFIGTTLHKITDSEIDKGEIISINKQLVQKDKSLIYNIFSLYEEGCKDIMNVVRDLAESGNISDYKVGESLKSDNVSNYYSYPTKEDFVNFKKKYKIFDNSEYYKEILGGFFNI